MNIIIHLPTPLGFVNVTFQEPTLITTPWVLVKIYHDIVFYFERLKESSCHILKIFSYEAYSVFNGSHPTCEATNSPTSWLRQHYFQQRSTSWLGILLSFESDILVFTNVRKVVVRVFRFAIKHWFRPQALFLMSFFALLCVSDGGRNHHIYRHSDSNQWHLVCEEKSRRQHYSPIIPDRK